MLKIVLFQPEIPGNTGSIGRTCLALGAQLILIKPYGFELNEKAVRRAGLDYWKHVEVIEYDDWQSFLDKEKPHQSELFFHENDGKFSVQDARYTKNSYLIFGSETKGLPSYIYDQYFENFFYLPQKSKYIRSINLANAVTAVAYQAHFKQS